MSSVLVESGEYDAAGRPLPGDPAEAAQRKHGLSRQKGDRRGGLVGELDTELECRPVCTEQAAVSWVRASEFANENTERAPTRPRPTETRSASMSVSTCCRPRCRALLVPGRVPGGEADDERGGGEDARAARRPPARQARPEPARQAEPPAAQLNEVIGVGFVSHAPIIRRVARLRRSVKVRAPGVARPRRRVVAQEVLHLGGRVLGAVARVEDQAADRDVLAGVEGDQPAVGLALVLMSAVPVLA